MLVAIYTFYIDRHAVHQQARAFDFDAAEAHLMRHDRGRQAVLGAEREDAVVEVRCLGSPGTHVAHHSLKRKGGRLPLGVERLVAL